jgi:hypothetical protein
MITTIEICGFHGGENLHRGLLGYSPCSQEQPSIHRRYTDLQS